jgi:hypothetical protein
MWHRRGNLLAMEPTRINRLAWNRSNGRMIPHDIVVMNTCDIPPPFLFATRFLFAARSTSLPNLHSSYLQSPHFFYRCLPKRAMSFLEFPEV